MGFFNQSTNQALLQEISSYVISPSATYTDADKVLVGNYYISVAQSGVLVSYDATSRVWDIPVIAGDTIHLEHGTGGSGSYQYIFVDKDNQVTVLGPVGTENFVISDFVVTGATTTKIRIHDVTASRFIVQKVTQPTIGKKNFYNEKRISILGDSVSTFTGYIPSGNEGYYTGSNAGVTSVNQTWWKRLIDYTGMSLLVNNSWSGSMVSTVNGDTSAGCMTRATLLHSGTTNPDIIIIFMGYNDFNLEVGLGTYNGTGAFPTATTTFREAYAIMLNKVLTQYPTSEIYCCTLPHSERNDETTFPEMNSNDVLLSEWNKAIKDMTDLFGVNIIDINKCGITHQNLNLYTGDWDGTTGIHPNSEGHRLIANKVIRTLLANLY
jgi:lysophospholipase L1-like esterase